MGCDMCCSAVLQFSQKKHRIFDVIHIKRRIFDVIDIKHQNVLLADMKQKEEIRPKDAAFAQLLDEISVDHLVLVECAVGDFPKYQNLSRIRRIQFSITTPILTQAKFNHMNAFRNAVHLFLRGPHGKYCSFETFLTWIDDNSGLKNGVELAIPEDLLVLQLPASRRTVTMKLQRNLQLWYMLYLYCCVMCSDNWMFLER